LKHKHEIAYVETEARYRPVHNTVQLIVVVVVDDVHVRARIRQGHLGGMP